MESNVSGDSPRSSLKQHHGSWTVFSAASGTGSVKTSLSTWKSSGVPSYVSMSSCDSSNGAENDIGVGFTAPGVKFTKTKPTARHAQGQMSALSAALRGCHLDREGSCAPEEIESTQIKRMEARRDSPGSCDTVPESGRDDRETDAQEAKPALISLPVRAGEDPSPSSHSSWTSYTTGDCPSLTDAESLDLVSRAEQRRALLERLMERLMERIYATLAHNYAKGDGGASTSFTPSSTTSAQTTSGQASRSSGKSGRGKRRPSQNDSDGSGESDDDGEEHRRPVSKRSKHKQNGTRMLACPFFKRNPQRYQRERSCVGPGWETMHRLK